MPNQITAAGIQVSTRDELLTYFTTALKAIYGNDINLDQDSPDGQSLNINIQAILDLEDLLVQICNGFDPDNAIGRILDQRVAINGIQRQAGTFTQTFITLVISQALTLYGRDQSAQPVYTVSDNAGNQFELVNTASPSVAGTYAYLFQAKNPGAVLTVPNTITIPVTVVLGVTSINNPTSYLVLGINEETDFALKVRRQRSVALPSQGYLAGLYAALYNIPGLTFAYIQENNTGSTDADGVPGHSIWVIVAGSASNAEIANAIYTKRNAGCGLYNISGIPNYEVVQVDGSQFPVYWDTVLSVPLYLTFTALSIDGVNPSGIAAIKNASTGLPSTFLPGPAATVNANQVGTLVQAIDLNTLVSGAGFSIETVQVVTFSLIAASGTFKFSYNGVLTAAINWNDNAATIQTKIRAISGLGSITVAGSIASKTLTITMTGITNPYMLGVSANGLLDGSAVAITLNFLSNFVSILTPSTKNRQFQISVANIVILPMILSAPGVAYVISSGSVTGTTKTVDAASTLQFTGLGGYGTLTYSVVTSTGSTINSSSGLYTAGTAGTDTVKVTDAQGHIATCTVTIS